jgi:hypothetical protein
MNLMFPMMIEIYDKPLDSIFSQCFLLGLRVLLCTTSDDEMTKKK